MGHVRNLDLSDLFLDIYHFYMKALLSQFCTKMDLNSLTCSDFDQALQVMDNFVKNVLNGPDKNQKRKMIEKLERYYDISRILLDNDQNRRGIQVPVPNEIWLKIMNYLDTKDIFGSLSQVNKHLNILSRDSSIIKSIDLMKISDETKFQNKLKILKLSRNIRHITVMSWDPTMKGLLGQIIGRNPKLRSLAFKYESLGGMISRVEFAEQYLNEIRNILKTFAHQIGILDLWLWPSGRHLKK